MTHHQLETPIGVGSEVRFKRGGGPIEGLPLIVEDAPEGEAHVVCHVVGNTWMVTAMREDLELVPPAPREKRVLLVIQPRDEKHCGRCTWKTDVSGLDACYCRLFAEWTGQPVLMDEHGRWNGGRDHLRMEACIESERSTQRRVR